jgi:hypothetical protein
MKKTGILLGLLILLLTFSVVAADSPDFNIRLRRDFGYGGMGNQIQGRFSILVLDEIDFTEVIFYMDETELGRVTSAPFRFQFSTDDYAHGEHVYWAKGVLPDGSVLTSNRISAFILSKEEANNSLGSILLVLFGGIGVAVAISFVVSAAVSRKVKQGEYFDENLLPKGYHVHGGTICKKCGKPYAYKAFSGNFITHKLDRCPHCGKWTFSRPVSKEVMIAAAVEMRGVDQNEKADSIDGMSEEEKLRKQLDESKYIG